THRAQLTGGVDHDGCGGTLCFNSEEGADKTTIFDVFTVRANTKKIICRSETATGPANQNGVADGGGIGKECVDADRGVFVAGSIASESLNTVGCVEAARTVV